MFNPLIDLQGIIALRTADITELWILDMTHTLEGQGGAGPWRLVVTYRRPNSTTRNHDFDFPTQNTALAAYANLKYLINQVEERNALTDFSLTPGR